MSVDCEGWARDGRKLPGLLVSGFDVANVLQMYRLAEPQASVVRLTISDMGENKPMPVHTPELGL